MTAGDALTIERRGRVAILSFNRPSVLNAFDGPLVEATTRAMSELGADEEVLCDRRARRGARLLGRVRSQSRRRHGRPT